MSGSAAGDPIAIRPMRPGEEPRLLELTRRLQLALIPMFDRMLPVEQVGQDYVDRLLAEVAKTNGTVLFADEGSRLLGYAALYLDASSEDEIDEVQYFYAYVAELLVVPEAQQRGLGARLMQACEALARAAGRRWIRVSVLAGNSAARGLYARCGYSDHLITLEKPLEP